MDGIPWRLMSDGEMKNEIDVTVRRKFSTNFEVIFSEKKFKKNYRSQGPFQNDDGSISTHPIGSSGVPANPYG